MTKINLNIINEETYKEAIVELDKVIHEITIGYNVPRFTNIRLRGLISYITLHKDRFVHDTKKDDET